MAHFRFRRSFGNVGTRRFRGARPDKNIWVDASVWNDTEIWID